MKPDDETAADSDDEGGLQELDEAGPWPRALGQLTSELRGLGAPPLDLEKLEARLVARLDAGDEPRHPLPPELAPAEARPALRRGVLVRLLPWASLAAAAAAALFFAHRAPGPSSVVQPSPTGRSPLAVALPAMRVETTTTPRTFSHDGLASWRLDAETVARVTERPDVVVLTLEKGAVEVDVVPNQPFPERFVVVAGKTRVAVRGTRFRVARVGERVELDVEHGLVAVGSTDRPGEAPAFLVSGPGGGSFGLDGDPSRGEARAFRAFGAAGALAPAPAAPGGRLAQAPAAADPRPAPSMVKASPGAPPSSPPGARPDPGAGKVDEVDEASMRARLSALAADCFERGARIAANVSVTVATTLSIEADPSGALGSPRFSPPLAPSVEACFREGLAQLRGPAGKFDIPLSLVGRR